MIDKYELTKIVSMNNDLFKSEYCTQPELELTRYQKLFLSLVVSKIEKDDTKFYYQEISINDYCDLFEINRRGGSNKKKIRDSILDIKNKFYIPDHASGAKDALRWVDDIQIDDITGIVKVKLAEPLHHYYLNLKKCFTEYQIGYISNLKSKYSIIVYEFVKSKQSLIVFYQSVANAKKELACGKYQSFSDFKRFVLDPAISEINLKTDITATYKAPKNGSKYELLLFCVQPKSGKALALADYWKIRYNKHEKNMLALKEAYEDVLIEIECKEKTDSKKEKREYEEMMRELEYVAEEAATAESKETRNRYEEH